MSFLVETSTTSRHHSTPWTHQEKWGRGRRGWSASSGQLAQLNIAPSLPPWRLHQRQTRASAHTKGRSIAQATVGLRSVSDTAPRSWKSSWSMRVGRVCAVASSSEIVRSHEDRTRQMNTSIYEAHHRYHRHSARYRLLRNVNQLVCMHHHVVPSKSQIGILSSTSTST